MIYIGTTDSPGQAIYLDIYAIEQSGGEVRVSALVGDGCYEGEVLIECAARSNVTYADAWLGGEGLDEFLQRPGQSWLQRQLLDSVRDHLALVNGAQLKRNRPVYPHQSLRSRGRVAETPPIWTQPA